MMRPRYIGAIGVAICTAVLAACGGVQRSAPIPATDVSQRRASVTFSIVVPSAHTTTVRRKTNYVSSATMSAAVAVTSPGAAPITSIVACSTSAGTCTGTVTAPIARDTFAVTLYDATNGTGNALSQGSISQNVIAGANTVNITFNPIVASARVTLTPPGPGPMVLYADQAACAASPAPVNSEADCGYTTIPVTVTALDADNRTIVGPGSYIDASGNPITLTLSNSDTTGTTLTGPVAFTAPPNATTTSLGFRTGAVVPPFDDPNLTVSVTGGSVPTLTGINVPVAPAGSPVGGYAWGSNGLGSVASIAASGDVTLTSPAFGSAAGVATQDATAAFKNYAFLTEDPTLNGKAVFVETGASGPASNRLAFLSSAGCTATGDGNNVDCPGTPPFAYNLAATIVSSDGNVWFAQTGTSLTLGKWLPVDQTAPAIFAPTPALPGTTQALLRGAGTSLYALVYDGSSKVSIVTVSSAGAFVQTGAFALSGGINIAGYAPTDAHLYVVGSDSTIYRVDPNATITTAPPIVETAAQNGHLANAAWPPMAPLPDGSLAYVGAGSSNAACTNGASLVHIVPGRVPNPVSVIPSLPTDQANYRLNDQCTFQSGLWAIGLDGSGNVQFSSSDGNVSHALAW